MPNVHAMMYNKTSRVAVFINFVSHTNLCTDAKNKMSSRIGITFFAAEHFISVVLSEVAWDCSCKCGKVVVDGVYDLFERIPLFNPQRHALSRRFHLRFPFGSIKFPNIYEQICSIDRHVDAAADVAAVVYIFLGDQSFDLAVDFVVTLMKLSPSETEHNKID